MWGSRRERKASVLSLHLRERSAKQRAQNKVPKSCIHSFLGYWGYVLVVLAASRFAVTPVEVTSYSSRFDLYDTHWLLSEEMLICC
jgi:hypothetical protein